MGLWRLLIPLLLFDGSDLVGIYGPIQNKVPLMAITSGERDSVLI